MTGQRVVLPDGRTGTVTAEYRESGCRCRTVIVRLPDGRDWVGKRAEVRASRLAGGPVVAGARYLLSESGQ